MTSVPPSPDLAPSNLQTQSPLFGELPAEIRNEIFMLALIQYEDDDEAYPEDSYWYRPGFHAPRKSSSALLRTCKLAYAEGKNVYLRELEWAFWFDRGPPGRSGLDACDHFFSTLSPSAVQKLTRVRFFTQMYWLEDGIYLRHIMAHDKFRPTTLTITIRYSDWWDWESNAPLEMQKHWLVVFKGSEGLRELKVEYETLAWKKEEMMKIVKRNKEIGLRVRGSDGHLSARETELVEWKWRGTSKLGGQTWEHHGKGDTVEYVVVMDRWEWVEGELVSGKEREFNEEELEEVYFHSSDEEDGDEEDDDEEEDEDEDQEGDEDEDEDENVEVEGYEDEDEEAGEHEDEEESERDETNTSEMDDDEASDTCERSTQR